ncbi:MAG TPA: gliding motility-associated C-terminal domain-containing protein [Chryseosolibacter sp.]
MTFVARITTFFLLLISFCAQAQFSSRLGRFQVNQVEGCAPFTINITSYTAPFKCDGTTPCDFSLVSASNPNQGIGQNISSFTFTQPGTYLFRILFQTSGFDDIQVVVNPNTTPAFELYTCAANIVAINITDTNFENYIVNYGDGSPETTFQRDISLRGTHTYASSGTRNISVRGINDNALDNCSAASQNINVMATLPIPTITQLQVLDESSIRVVFTGLPNIVYRLEVSTNNAPSFQTVRTLYNVTADTVRNIRPEDNYYCYRIGVVNPCTGVIQYSNLICSANVDLTVQNNVNSFRWVTRTTGVSNFRVTRSTAGSTLATNTLASPYNDVDITCGREYCYQLTTLYPNGSQSSSLLKCGTAISNDVPDPIGNISTIVNGNSVDITWLPDPQFTPQEYFVQKNVNGVFNNLQSTTATSITDPAYSTDAQTCYKIYYKDVCGNQSPVSAEACPIRLTGSLQSDNAISLSWSDYTGWANGVNSYTVQKLTPEGALLQTSNAATSTSFLDDEEDLLHQALMYVVTANAAQAGVTASISNKIIIIRNPNLFYPTAFTPNNDNLNDIFNVYGQFIDEFEMSIFNRWGELMYTTTNISEGWDGKFKGNDMPEGTYTFIVRIQDRAGRQIKESGSVLLLRKK